MSCKCLKHKNIIDWYLSDSRCKYYLNSEEVFYQYNYTVVINNTIYNFDIIKNKIHRYEYLELNFHAHYIGKLNIKIINLTDDEIVENCIKYINNICFE